MVFNLGIKLQKQFFTAGTILACFVVILCASMKSLAYEEDQFSGDIDPSIIDLVKTRSADPIVEYVIDDFDGDGITDAFIATSSEERTNDYSQYNIWYIKGNDISEYKSNIKENFRWFNSYTLSGYKFIAIGMFENHVTSQDEVYYFDKEGMHFLGVYPTTREQDGYMVSSQGLMDLEGWYYEEKAYAFENGELVFVKDWTNSFENEENQDITKSSDWYNDYTYELDEVRKTITLKNYIGSDEYVFVNSKAIINGDVYNTYIDGYAFSNNGTIKSLSFGCGCVISGDSLSFQNCQSLEYLDLYGLDSSNVTNMFRTFSGCSSLSKVRLGGLNTSNVVTMENMFDGCSSLTVLNLYNWDVSKVTNFSEMLLRCKALETFVEPKNAKGGIEFPVDRSLQAALKDMPEGTEYFGSCCKLVKEDDGYYLYPVFEDSWLRPLTEGINSIEFVDGIRMADDAEVFISTRFEMILCEEDSYDIDYHYETYPFYEKVDELFENGHWIYEDDGYGKDHLEFRSEDGYIADFMLLQFNEDGEISVLKDYYCE